MPNYHFKCLECSHQFQKLLPVGHPDQKCLDCGQKTQKLLGAPGVQFKGSGFYSTDSKSNSPKKSAPSKAAQPAPAKTEKKTDSTTSNSASDKS